MADNDVWTNVGVIAAPAATDRIPIATAPNAGGWSARGDFIARVNGYGGFYGSGGHATAYSRLYSSGDGASDDASLDWFASHPGVSYSGAGIGSNLDKHRVVGKRRATQAAGCVEFDGPSGDIVIFSATPGQATLTRKLTIKASNGFVGVGDMVSVNIGAAFHSKGVGETLRCETTAPRGSGSNYLAFFDPTGRKGILGFGSGVNDSMFLINDMNLPLYFGINGSSQWQINGGNFGPAVDAGANLAAPGARVANSYFSVTPTVTSDEREKKWRGGLTKAELKAATTIIAELGFYQWTDAVAEKGKDARYHFGARAQRVWQIMADEKLVAPITGTGKNQRPGKTPYAFLCWDEWDEQTEPEMRDEVIPAKFEGKGKDRIEVEPERTERVPTGKTLVTRNAGNRFGLRTDQFVMFLVAAQEARLAAVEAFIAKAG